MAAENLKCPACGFERLETDVICLMCGIDFRIYKPESAAKPQDLPQASSVDSSLAKKDIDNKQSRGSSSTDKNEPGFHAGPLCPSCGFERMPHDRVCLMCGIDFAIYDAESSKNKIRNDETGDEESGVRSSDDSESFVNLTGFEPGDDENRLVMEFEETGSVVGFCPNCKSPRYADDFECRQCGVIFSKVDSARRSQNQDDDDSFANDRMEAFRAQASSFFSSAFSSSKNIIESFSRLIPDFIGLLRQLFYNFVSAAWSFKKQILILTFLVVIIASGFFVFKYVADSLRDSNEKQKRLALEAELAQKADYFRINAFSIRDNILLIMDTRGIDAALEEIKKVDIENLKYNPVLQILKDSLNGELLRKKLISIPFDDYKARFDAYGKLCEIYPDNDSYKELLKMNRLMLAAKDAAKAEELFFEKGSEMRFLDEAIFLAERAFSLDSSDYNESLVFRLKSARLLVFEGNENVQMALRDDAFSGQKNRNQRKIRVWLKNTGAEPFRINPDFFSLQCYDGNTYQYNDFSRNLLAEVQPGATIEGDVFFYTKSRPMRFVFDHAKLGAISRDLP